MKTSKLSWNLLVLTVLALSGQQAFSQANNSLSNLDPTGINQSLFPQDNGNLDLGSPDFSWKNFHFTDGIYQKGTRIYWTPDEDNLFIGPGSGSSFTEGEENLFIGLNAGHSFTGGEYNTIIGINAGYSLIDAEWNTFIGTDAGFNDQAPYNTFIGTKAGYNTTSGHSNVFIGYGTGLYNTVGKFNTSLGYGAGAYLTTGYGNVFIGHNSYPTTGKELNSIAIGNAAVISASNQTRIGGPFATSIGGYVNWSNVSDARFKKNITDEVHGLDFILGLRPVVYNLDISAIESAFIKNTNDPNGELAKEFATPESKQCASEKEAIQWSGFIAQEVEATAQKIGYDFSGVDAPKNEHDFYGLRYADFVVPLVKAVQEQQNQIAELQKQIDELKAVALSNGSNDGTTKISYSKETTILGQNIPNPFDNGTIIPFRVPSNCASASIAIAESATGKIVRVVPIACGETQLSVEAGSLSAGTYSYSLYVDGKMVDTHQMVIAR